jgi:hypothetical protein
MLEVIRSRLRSALLIGIAAALVGGGVAFAGSGGGSSGPGESGGGSSGQGSGQRERRLPPPPAGPGPIRGLTWAEFHYQRNGEARVTRVDTGKVVSVSDSSLTIAENDGNEVTIPVDESTRVFDGPGKDSPVSDLKEGQQVVVGRPEGGAADQILVPPTAAEIRRHLEAGGPPRGRLGPAPHPGARLAIPLPPPPGRDG